MTQGNAQNKNEVVAMPLPHGAARVPVNPGAKADVAWPNIPDPPASAPSPVATMGNTVPGGPGYLQVQAPPPGLFGPTPASASIFGNSGRPPLPQAAPSISAAPAAAAGPAATSGHGSGASGGGPSAIGPAALPSAASSPLPIPAPVRQARSEPDSRRRTAGSGRPNGEAVPSIGGLIFSLHQKPSRKPFVAAAAGTALWLILGLIAGYAMLGPDARNAQGIADFLMRPAVMTVAATVLVPIALFWFLALLVWRAQELRLMSSAMTEVAVRLAEPDRMAEQSVASLGQSVRRQVSFMNDAIGRAIGRASELEGLVHTEVAALERSYSENEYRIRNLIEELASERAALANNSVRVSEALSGIGAKVTREIADASRQATEQLTQASQSLGQLIEARASAITESAHNATTLIDNRLSERGNSLLSSLSVMTQRIGTEVPVIIERMSQEQVRLTKIIESAGGNLSALEAALANRTQALGAVLEDNTRNMDRVMSQRSEALEVAFGKGLQSLDKAFDQGAQAFDNSVSQRTMALAAAMESHAHVLGDSLARKSADLDQTLSRGIEAVRRSSETITRQSIKTIDGLASQAGLLKDVSENLLSQINTLTGRFENQGKTIMKAAHALETSNMKVDSVLQTRHSELSELLEKMNDRARSFDHAARDYTATVGNSLTEVERRALQTTQEIARSTQQRSSEAMAELQRFKATTETEADRMLADLKGRLNVISSEVTSQLTNVSSRVNESSDEMRGRALKAADELESMQTRLRDQMQTLPETSKTSAEQIRRALSDQLAALEQLTAIAGRQSARQDVATPERASLGSLTQAYTSRMAAQNAVAGPGGGPMQARLPEPPAMTAQIPAAMPAQLPGGPNQRTGWSLGDLLDRASRDEGGGGGGGGGHQGPAINVGNIAQAIDPITAADVWTRVRAGQRGILNRGLYTQAGQSTFDEIFHRYKGDNLFQESVNRYLGDFERLLTDAEAREPGGRIAENYLLSDTGRVYLLLAHASGRLA